MGRRRWDEAHMGAELGQGSMLGQAPCVLATEVSGVFVPVCSHEGRSWRRLALAPMGKVEAGSYEGDSI